MCLIKKASFLFENTGGQNGLMNALALIYGMTGIPIVYYGTEQGTHQGTQFKKASYGLCSPTFETRMLSNDFKKHLKKCQFEDIKELFFL